MASHKIALESPRRRRPLESNSCIGQITPRTQQHFAMPSRDCSDAESPIALRGRKLSFGEGTGRANVRMGQMTYCFSSGSNQKLIKSTVLLFISLSMVHMFWWRAPLMSFMSDTKLNKEQDLDAWTLLQKDVDLLRSRQAKRNSRRREKPKKKAVQRNGLFFMTVPKLRRKPLDLQIPSIDASLQSIYRRVVPLDASHILQFKQRKLQPWIFYNTTYPGRIQDEPDMTRSQTVVYESDQNCIPMAEWQSTFHVSSSIQIWCITSLGITPIYFFLTAHMQLSSRNRCIKLIAPISI